MEVRLIRHTPDALRVLHTAARTCYSAQRPSELWGGAQASREAMERLIRRIAESGHLSVLEHVSFTFALEGLSRVASHQLVRHRLASFSQQSQRYVEGPFAYVTPSSWLGAGEDLSQRYHRAMALLDLLYEDALAAGIPSEDARFVLPQASSTNLTMTMNLRELIHVVGLRTCVRAQWEIRRLFERLREAVHAVDPFLASFLVTKCERLGYCDERESCGRYPTRAEFFGREE